MQPWTKKYEPKKANEIIGQNEAITRIRDFLKNFKRQNRKAALLHGPNGSGKTVAVYAVARELNYEILEVNASDFRNKEKVESVVGSAIGQRSLFGGEKLILADEVDGLSGTNDRGGLQALMKIMEKAQFPIILTANDPFSQKFNTLRNKTRMIEFKPLAYLDIFAILESICKKEGIKFDELSLKGLARRAGGDMRAAINDLQSVSSQTSEIGKDYLDILGSRDEVITIQDALTRILKTTKPDIALSALNNVHENMDQVMLWLDENLPKEYTKPDELYKAYECLSRADVFNGRIKRRQHWRFLAYINELITVGIALSKKEKYSAIANYTPTTRIFKLWMANQKYMKRKDIAAKIALCTHCSAKEAIQNTVPYMKIIFKNDKKMADNISKEIDLDKEQIGWLRK
ncbi:replication factor C large subunit [Candidatus Woesearchaeota archaeon]|nr:replication factor C large subunit [Candidatus Woesearchaeota archaeon]